MRFRLPAIQETDLRRGCVEAEAILSALCLGQIFR